MKISEVAVERPVAVAMIWVGLALIGIFAAFRLPVEQFPRVEIPFVSIGVPYANSTAQEVERMVTRPVEEVLSTMSGVHELYSFSRPGYAHFNLMLDFDRDVLGKGIEAKELIEGIRHRLPDSIRYIQLRQKDPNSSPVLNLMITAPDLNVQDAYDTLDTHIRAELERVPGVNTVTLFGVDKNYIRIALDAGRMEAYGLDYQEVQRRLQRANFFVSAGNYETNVNEFQIRPLGRFKSVDEIRALPINNRGLVINDVATVSLAITERSERKKVNGERSLGVTVFKSPESNLVEVSNQIEATLERVKNLPQLKGVSYLALDSMADSVLQSLTDLRNSGFLGGVLSIIVLFIFLRQMTPSILVAATVPLALSTTLGVMYFSGMTLNILSLVGLMLAIGLLVDNAVVAVESIGLKRRESGANPVTAARDGASDVMLAITAGTLTTVIVFVPSFMTDVQVVATIQQNIAVPLCTSLLASLLVAQTLVPAAMARLPIPKAEPEHPIIDRLSDFYERVVRLTMRYKFLTLLVAIGIGASGFGAYRLVDVNMNPEEESERLTLRYYVRGSMDIEYIEGFVNKVDAYLLDNKAAFQIDNVVTSYDTDRGSTIINLIPETTLSAKVAQEMILKDLPLVPNIRARFRSHSRGPGSRSSGSDSGLSMKLMGESTYELIRISDEIVAILEQDPALSDVQSNTESSRQELQIRLKAEQAAKLGVTANAVAQAVAIAVGGKQLNRGFVEDGKETDIHLELEGKDSADLTTINRLPIFVSEGQTVPLETIADISFTSTLRSIRRHNRETSVDVRFTTSEGPPAVARAIVEDVMKKYEMPPGYRWQMGKEFDEDDEMFREMAVNMLLAICLIYMLMAALFESVLFPTAVLIAIGYSIVGVFWFLAATGTQLTAMALTGMLLLGGIVVNNGIVLMNRILQLRRGGMPRTEAIVTSGRDRLRPILLTVCTTIAGMTPLAIGDTRVGGVGPTYFPMARTLIGGLAFSTVVTLVFLPLVYVLFDDLKNSASNMWQRAKARAVAS